VHKGGSVAAIIVAAGSGTRFGGEKQLLELGGIPLYQRVIEVFMAVDSIEHIVLVCSPSLIDLVNAPAVHKVLGGSSRQESVRVGIEKAGELGCEIALVHDAARALVTTEIIDRVLESTRRSGASIAAVPVVDTIKEVEGGTIARTIPRAKLWRAQTPQGARIADLLRAYENSSKGEFTDEAELLESIGTYAQVVLGSEENFKITYPEDLERAQQIIAKRTSKEAIP
jgi:2-C-methyl-D-erythritol 4-phosphate cytidylyltransferase